jgi:ribosomal protein L12E/L44/L45/RPP1/RPP2
MGVQVNKTEKKKKKKKKKKKEEEEERNMGFSSFRDKL